MEESNISLNPTFDWTCASQSESHSDFHFTNSFSTEFPSLSIDIPNQVENCPAPMRQNEKTINNLFTPNSEAEKSGFVHNEEFFHSLASSSSYNFLDPKHGMLTNLDSHLNETLATNYDLTSSILPVRHSQEQPNNFGTGDWEQLTEDLFVPQAACYQEPGTSRPSIAPISLMEGPDESMDALENIGAPSQWSEIGGAAVLCRSLPEGSKELLSLMRVPQEAKKRKFLTVREMLNIKKKLSNAKSKCLKELIMSCSEESFDEDSSDQELQIHIPDESSPASSKKVPIASSRTASNKRSKKRIKISEDFSEEEAATPHSVDSQIFHPPAKPLVPLPAFTDPPISSSSSSFFGPWNQQAPDFGGRPKPPQQPPAPLTMTSLSPRSREVLDYVSPGQQKENTATAQRTLFTDSYSRPRHFEFRLLQIGTYQFVATSSDPNERLSRLKVIFTTQKFVYEYEMPPRISTVTDGRILVTRMISVEVPFSTVVGLECTDSVVRMLVDTQPFVFIGYRTHYPDQSRCCVYERMADSDFTRGELATSPLHRLVFLRPEAATKLKYHLSNFNSRFASLIRSPFPIVTNHIPHWPLRMQNIFTIPKDDPPSPMDVVPAVDVTPKTNTRKMCTCRTSCRSKRCSCVRQGKSCNPDSGCRCQSCDNPINFLYNWGIDPEWAENQSCLTQNIFSIQKNALNERLHQAVACPGCGAFSILVEMLAKMSNMSCSQCNIFLNYSWCRGLLYSVQSKSLVHCDSCNTCVLGNYLHCQKCEVCLLPVMPNNTCPRCGQGVH